MTRPIRTVDVRPHVPERLRSLYELSDNLYFAWDYGAEELFRRINPDLWEETRRNPVELLGRVKQNDLENVRGNYDENSFVTGLREENRKIEETADSIIQRIENLKV